jgi:hypothetical protein
LIERERQIPPWRAPVENKKVIDKRQIRLEEVLRPDYIPFLGGRPERETIIMPDDIVNLKIILNTTDSVEELINNA